MSDISHLTAKETYSDPQGAMYTPMFREDITPGDLTPGFSFYLSHPILQCLSYSKLTCLLFPKCTSQGRWSFAAVTNQLKISEAYRKNVVSCSHEVYCRYRWLLAQLASTFSYPNSFLLLASPSQHFSLLQMKKQSEGQASAVNHFGSEVTCHFHSHIFGNS